MNVSLTDRLKEFVQKKVASGRYHSASEVVREGLRLLEERDRVQEVKLEALKRDLQEGLDSGDSVPFDAERIRELARRSGG